MKVQNEKGLAELKAARAESRSLYWAVAIFSFLVNMLMLTGPLFMLQVYDRVLGSGSKATLLGLSLLVLFLFSMMGLLDYVRGRVMARVAARFQARLGRRVFDAVMRKSAVAPDETTHYGLADLTSIQRLMTSNMFMSMFDMPFAPLFFLGIFIFHPWLGILGLCGAVLLVVLSLMNNWMSSGRSRDSDATQGRSDQIASQIRGQADAVQSMGMRDAAFDRWDNAREDALQKQIKLSDVTGGFMASTKSIRMTLQSAMLALGALLVLNQEMTAGAMIAGSILLGRALAPIELALGQWQLFQRAREGWGRLSILLTQVPAESEHLELPKPKSRLDVRQLTIVPPGQRQATLRSLSFAVEPGDVIGVIGTSGSGKSTLARAITGLWPPAGGSVRLDGAALSQYAHEALGRHIGYLPQDVPLFDGTIAENIAKLAHDAPAEAIVAAAKAADAHEMIVSLPEGYDTRISSGKVTLSGGQIQRIGLARALFGDPAIVILDEPNSNLDNSGSEAVNTAIRSLKAAGKAVMIMAHRPAAIKECDKLLVLDKGQLVTFGPRDEVLQKTVKNHGQLKVAGVQGGVS